MTVLFRRFGGPTWLSTRKVPSQVHSLVQLETSSTSSKFPGKRGIHTWANASHRDGIDGRWGSSWRRV